MVIFDLLILWIFNLFFPPETEKEEYRDDSLTYIILDELDDQASGSSFQEYKDSFDYSEDVYHEEGEWE